jgi:hypothetical protein
MLPRRPYRALRGPEAHAQQRPAIVRQAAEACGGFAQAENAPDGGALLRVSFGPAERAVRAAR